MQMNLNYLLAPWFQDNIPSIEIKALSNDSRHISPQSLFIAYPGEQVDGRDFILDAEALGAVAIVYEAHAMSLDIDALTIPAFPIQDLSTQLANLACRFYEHPSQALTVIGVTGTNGKTSIAYQLAQAYALLQQPSVYMGTIGYGKTGHLSPLANTTPDALTLQALLREAQDTGARQFCMEVSSHALSLARVAGVAFSQAIYTNLSHDHLDFHHTLEAYAASKAQLFAYSSLKNAIINIDDAYASLMLKAVPKTCQSLSYGLGADADVRATHWKMDLSGSQISVQTPWGNFEICTQSVGQFNLYNTLAVLTSLLAAGFTSKQIIPIMPLLKAAPGRLEIVAQAPCVLVDYAHTPDALDNTLQTLQALKKNRLWLIFGCGGDRDKLKRPIMGDVACRYADEVIVTSDNPRRENPLQIIADIVEGMPQTALVKEIEDREQAIAYVLARASVDDIVLIAGKGHEDYQQIGHIKHPFSDHAMVQKYLNHISEH